MDAAYYELNLKVLDRKSFNFWLMKKIQNNEIIEVSDEYYQEQLKYAVYPMDKITNLYANYGIDSFVNYLYHYPINQLYREDPKSFDWASYLLWQNDIHVALDHEAVWYYIDMDGYRYWHE